MDRLLSNPAFNVWELFAHWVPYVLGATPEIVVALDWTDFDADGHSTIALSLVTAHGRATPLVWMSVKKAQVTTDRYPVDSVVCVKARGMKQDLLDPLVHRFGEYVLREPVYVHAFSLE